MKRLVKDVRILLFTFSFSNKKELIHVKEISHTAQIGNLLRHFIDIDWKAFSTRLQSEFGMQDFITQQVFQVTKEYVGGLLPDDAIELAVQRTLDIENQHYPSYSLHGKRR